ncbi:hypothetical protein [Erythrobacter donghaensis]|jgi:signal transduction histidine kinase|uniref:hypothetical protein n=1 Tax=Erythrobacter donghaensis TaxID=267135 RepID=UPI000B25DC0F|nr:hypothetical protein [Erythrobacter donghaensis]
MASQKIVMTDVPIEKLQIYKKMAENLGGKFVSVQQEPDGEFTVVILLPDSMPGS